ncbi:hypothetical protein FACS1894187_24840 [Synergistales bacterium]|nr:hypothetical protein FACS1894187_24840 [Synergistales bacterium]
MRLAEVFKDGTLGHIYTPEELESYDVNALLGIENPEFEYKECPECVETGWLYEDGAFVPPPEPEIAPPTLEEAKIAKLSEIAAARFAAETGGVVINGNGISIDTSRESQALITGAALQATIDSAYSCRWKTTNGFVEFTSEMILAVAVAVRQHVQACFDREADLSELVDAAATVEEIEAVTWL